MCGILLSEDILNGKTLSLIKMRGKDYFREDEKENAFLASSVLSIRSFVEQPVIESKYTFLYNGEIFNESESDTLLIKEIIESVINNKITAHNVNINSSESKNEKIYSSLIFKEDKNFQKYNLLENKDHAVLDFTFIEAIYNELQRYESEMALAILMDNKVYFFKDNIGRRSLGISFEPFVLSSVNYNDEIDSMKIYMYDLSDNTLYSKFKPYTGIIKLYFERIDWIRYYLNLKKYATLYLHFTGYSDESVDKEFPKQKLLKCDVESDDELILDELIEAFNRSVAKRLIVDSPIIIFFSGGIDSLIIAIFSHLLSPKNTKIYLINTAFPDSFDRIYGFMAYQDLVSMYGNEKFVFVKKDLNIDEINKNSDLIKSLMYPKYNKMAFNICVVMFFSGIEAAKYGNVVYLGSGADEIFGGYNRYKETDFRSEMFFDLFTISSHNICRDDRVIGASSVEARFPFLDSEIVKFSLNLSDSHLVNNETKTNKVILRNLLVKLGFNRASMVPKKAMQYGSGIQKYESKFSGI